MKKPPLGLLAAAAIAAIALPNLAFAQSTWINPTNGNWSTTSAWSTPGGVPNASNAIAVFSNNWTGQTITVDGTYTVGQILGRDTVLGGGGLLLSGGVLVLNSGATKPIISTDNNLTEPGGTAPFNNPLRITSELQGTNGFEKTGPGYLSLEGANTFSGTILLTAPASGGGSFLRLINDNNLGASTNDINVTLSGQAVGLYASTGFTVTLNSDRDIVTSGTGDFWSKTKGTGNIIIDGVISGSARFRKNDAGFTTLRGSNTFTGGVLLDGGTLALAGGNNRLNTNSLVAYNSASTLVLSNVSQTISNLTTGTTYESTISGSGGSLTVNGATATTFTASRTTVGTSLNMSNLSSFTIIGANGGTNREIQFNANGANITNTIFLARTNTFTAPLVNWGIGGANAAGQRTIVQLGQSNFINATNFNIGAFQGSGEVFFQSGLSSPSLTIRGTNGTSAIELFTVGYVNSGNQGGTGILNLAGGSLDVVATRIDIAQQNAGATTTATGTLSMPAGTVVAETLSIARKTATGGSPVITGTFNQSGGTVTATNLYLGESAAVSGGLPTLTANYNLTGGTLYAQTISGNGAAYGLSTVRNLNISGGTVQNIAGQNLTINGLDNTASGRINVVLGASGGTFNADTNQSITVGANSLISGASTSGGILTKAGNGTLVLSSANTYTAGTRVGAGTVIADNDTALGTGAVQVTNGSVVATAGKTIANDFVIGVTASASNSFTNNWNFGTSASNTSANSAWGVTSGVVSSEISRGNNNGTSPLQDTTSPSSGYSGSSGNFNTGAAVVNGTLSSASTYFEFSLVPTAGYSFSLTNITFGSRSTGTGPLLATISSSLDGYTAALGSNALLANSTWALISPGISASTATNGAVSFRIYASGGTGAVQNTVQWRIDDLGISGYTLAPANSGTGTLGITDSGAATFSGGITVNNTATLTAATGGTATFSGAISGPGTDITKSGAGTVTLSGTTANTFAGKTTVSQGTLQLNKTAGVNAIAGDLEVASTATLLISANNQVVDTSAVTLSGGTIARASGVSETFGDLTLSSSGTLDYGSGTAGVLEFGAWTPGSSVLTINSFFADNILRFSSDLSSFISSSTGTSFSNANFSINGMTAAGFTTNWNGSTFTITSVPEPSTVLAALGLTGLMLWPARRRIGALVGRK